MDKLLPCKVCGGEGKLITGPGRFDRVQCQCCGATGPWFDGHPRDAINGWNTRPLPNSCMNNP